MFRFFSKKKGKKLD